jgi:hypothetical protein
VQRDRQATAMWLGDEVVGGWCGGSAEPAGLELHTGTMESVLVEGGSVGVPCSRLTEDRIGFSSNFGRTPGRSIGVARLTRWAIERPTAVGLQVTVGLRAWRTSE